MPMHNLTEYRDNYSDTLGYLWQFNRDEIEGNADLTVDLANHIRNSLSPFKYKSNFITKRNGVKIVVPLKYLSNFWRLLEMPLINCKIKLSLTWNPNCVLPNLVGNSTFTITEDNTKSSKLLTEGFKSSVYWNKYKIISNRTYDQNNDIRE